MWLKQEYFEKYFVTPIQLRKHKLERILKS